MVKRIIFFALFVLLVACERESKQNNYWKNIDLCQELGFKRDTNLIKPILIATYYQKEGFCSNIINLYNDSTFEREGGCEGTSSRTLGKWKINKNNLILKESPLNELNLVYNYSISGDTSNYLVISISNRFDKPLSQFALHAFNNSVKSPYNLHTDENGIIRLKKEAYDSISIVAFKEIRNKIFTIKREKFPDTLSLKIYTDGINYYGWPKYTSSKKEYFYKIKKDKIIMDEYNFEMRKITNR